MSEDKKPEARIVFNSDLYWGIPLYVTHDPKQTEYHLIEIKLLPGVTDKKNVQIPAVKVKLDSMDGSIWVYDFQISTEPDGLKVMKAREQGDDDDDD
jgi:hypothetical protein